MVSFAKEFENYILSDKREESLISLIPGSEADIYLQIIKSLNEMEEKGQQPEILQTLMKKLKNLNINAYNETNFRRLLKLYDLPENTEEQKLEILKELKELICPNLKFNYTRPTNSKINLHTSSDESKFPSELDQNFIKTPQSIIDQFYKEQQNYSLLQQIERHDILKLLDINKLTPEFLRNWIINNYISMPLLENDDKIIKKIAEFLDEEAEREKYFPYINGFLAECTIDIIESLSYKINSNYCDKNIFLNLVINKTYQNDLNIAETNSEKREILLKIYEKIKDFQAKYQAFKSNIILEILNLNVKLNIYDLDLFKEYIKNPVTGNWTVYKHTQERFNILNSQQRYYISGINSTSSDLKIISEHLDYFFLSKSLQIKEFEEYLEINLLKRSYFKAAILKGEENEEIIKFLGQSEYETIVNKIEITICKHNKEKFLVDEDVILELDIKNIQTLFVKIFEINTENYYYTKMTTFDTSLSLEGLVASSDETFIFNEKPQIKKRKDFKFSTIPKKRGLYIIEFIGGGYSSRAIIKKGNLSLISNETPIGKKVFLLNENSEICKPKKSGGSEVIEIEEENHHTTGIWFKSIFYPADENGSIIIPHGLNIEEDICIMNHEGYSEIGRIHVDREVYDLKGAFHVNHESLVMGNTAKFIFNPMLLMNGKEINLNKLKKGVLTAKISKTINGEIIPSSQVFDNVNLENNKEFTFELQIPPKLRSIDLSFEAEIFNISRQENQKIIFCYSYNNYEIEENFIKMFLRKTEEKYNLYILGKNGEPKADCVINLSIRSSELNAEQDPIKLQTDEDGRIRLGKLENIIKIEASLVNNNYSNIRQKWDLAKERKILYYPNRMDKLEDELIVFPVINTNLTLDQLFLFKCFNNEPIQKMNDKLKFIPLNEEKTRFNIEISGLKKGEYTLLLGKTDKLDIQIHKGRYWESENYIISDNYNLGIENQNFLSLSDVKIDQEKDEIFIKVQNANKNTRLHIYAYQFINPCSESFFEDILTMQSSKTVNSTQKINRWSNFYLDNRKLNDEIQYVFDRKNLERQMGNSLEKPSLLLKRKFIRDTTTEKENLEIGTNYEKKEMEMFLQKADIKPMSKKKMMKRSMQSSERDECYQSYSCASNAISSAAQNYKNAILSFNNFLSEPANLILNVPVTNEEFIKISDLKFNNYSQIRILCINDSKCYEEVLSLKENKIERRDLTLKESLQTEKSFAELRITECYGNKSYVKIDDITSTSYKIIDSLEKVVNYKILLNSAISDKWKEFKFLLNFDDLSESEKKKKITKYFSHELNVFLYFKYPKIFESKILPILKFKSEKTLIDFFLMNDKENIIKFISPKRIEEMNIMEKCLFIYFLRENHQEIAREIANSITAQTADIKNESEIKVYFDILMNTKNEGEKAHEEILFMDSEPERMMSLGANRDLASRGINKMAKPMMMKCMAMPSASKMPEQREMLCDMLIEEEWDHDIQEATIRKNFDVNTGKTKEYCETHFLDGYSINKNLIAVSKFWADCANYWSDLSYDSPNNFLSKNIILKSYHISELIFSLAVLDLPFKTKNHTFSRHQEMGLKIETDSNIILFTKCIKESITDLDNNLMIAQSVYLNDFNSGNPDNKNVSEFLHNKIYCHKTNIINLSPKKINFDVLIQIPQGAIPVRQSDYTKTINQNLENNICEFLNYFYFPNPGEFIQYPPTASKEGVIISKGASLKYSVVQKQTVLSSESLDDVLETGSKDDILNFFSKQKFINKKDLSKIYWIMIEKDFFLKITEILRNKGIYDENIWLMGFLQYDPIVIKEYLDNQFEYKNYVSNHFKSFLFTVDNSNDYNVMNHLDYHPLLNSRVHKIGQSNKLTILNKEFRNTYQNFIISLIRKKEINSKDYLRLTYYLLLQDRVDEAIRIFKKIKSYEISKHSSLEIQYDYINAYLDFCLGFPDFTISRNLCQKYKNFPLEHWNELFEELEDQLIEFDGKAINDDIDSILDEEKKKKINVKNAFLKEPKLSFSIENKIINISYQNLDYFVIKFYLIDLEVLFSRTPFFKQNSNDFTYVQPNFLRKIALEKLTKEQIFSFEIPNEFISSNIMIEISSLATKAFDTYFSTSLKISISESLGEVKVTNKEGKCLNKVYVKCFAQMKNGDVSFYKDGYTDLRGKFNYISLNTDSLKDISKFSLFVMDDNLGSAIKECNLPANISSSSGVSDYDNYMNHRQEVKSKWRIANKK